MELNENGSCFECKHYTDTIGEKGYCKLYRHNTSTPEVMCPKFERAVRNEYDETSDGEKMIIPALHKMSKEKQKLPSSQILLVAAILSCLVFTVIAFIFGVIISTTVISFSSVDLITRIIFVVTVCLFLLSVIVLSYMLISRFITMRVFYLAASTVTVVFMLINYDTVWFNFHALILAIVETVFNIAY